VDAPRSAFDRLVSGLSAETTHLLAPGAEYWSDRGPATIDDELSMLMGFEDLRAAPRHFGQLKSRLHAGEEISVLDLTRVLWLTAIGIVSVVVGPRDWDNVFGTSGDYDMSMATAFAALQRAQDELGTAGVPASGTDPFGKHALPLWRHRVLTTMRWVVGIVRRGTRRRSPRQ
jgi:hypothetical protein